MAKRVRESAASSGGGDDETTVQSISKPAQVRLLKKIDAAQNAVDAEKESLDAVITKGLDEEHAHKGVLKSIIKLRKLFAKSPAKLQEWLFHFDVMRKNEGWDDQSDMFRGDPEGSRPADEPDEAEAASGDDGKVVPLRAGDDDASDLRPRHLRSGSSDPDPSTQH